MIGEDKLLSFDIEKSFQDTENNLVKAAKYTGLNDNKLTDLKLILPKDYSKYLKLPQEVEEEGKGKEDQERQKPAQIALELAEEKCKKLFLDQFGTSYIAIKINEINIIIQPIVIANFRAFDGSIPFLINAEE